MFRKWKEKITIENDDADGKRSPPRNKGRVKENLVIMTLVMMMTMTLFIRNKQTGMGYQKRTGGDGSGGRGSIDGGGAEVAR